VFAVQVIEAPRHLVVDGIELPGVQADGRFDVLAVELVEFAFYLVELVVKLLGVEADFDVSLDTGGGLVELFLELLSETVSVGADLDVRRCDALSGSRQASGHHLPGAAPGRGWSRIRSATSWLIPASTAAIPASSRPARRQIAAATAASIPASWRGASVPLSTACRPSRSPDAMQRIAATASLRAPTPISGAM
jgi:hypothetical protein